jgi:hypothetical protein
LESCWRQSQKSSSEDVAGRVERVVKEAEKEAIKEARRAVGE